MRIQFSLFLAFLFLISTFSSVQAQELELGVKGGFMVYSGDLSPKEFGVYFEDVNPAGGIYLRYRPTPRIGIRVNGDFGRISAERDAPVPDGLGNSVVVTRNFRSAISNFGIVGEIDLFYLGDRTRNFFAPYVYGGIGVTTFNPEGELDGVWNELQPLRTEAQGSGLSPEYAPTPYDLTVVALSLGAGVRVRFSDRFVIGLELGGFKPRTDYLDDVGNTPVRYLDVLQGNNGGLAARYSNPGVENPAEITDLTYRRGGEFEDYFWVGSLTVGVTIGAGGSKKSGCYTF
jgi:hypothetical protein